MEEQKELKEIFTENSNIIGFIIVLAVYIGISFFDGGVNNALFYDGWRIIDWVVFVAYPLVTAITGSVAKSFLKKQGVRHGLQEEEVHKVHQKLLILQASGKEEEIPDGYEKFFIKGSIKSTFSAYVFSICLTLLTTIMIVDFSLTNIITMFTTLSVWICLGISDYTTMFDYIRTKHIVRMRYEIKKLEEKNNVSVD